MIWEIYLISVSFLTILCSILFLRLVLNHISSLYVFSLRACVCERFLLNKGYVFPYVVKLCQDIRQVCLYAALLIFFNSITFCKLYIVMGFD